MLSKKNLFLILILEYFYGALSFISDDGVVHVEKAVEYYNSFEGSTWEAHHNNFRNLTISHIKSKLGLLPHFEEDESDGYDSESSTEENLPENYDCREAFVHCPSISSIKDQANCESCWAISIASVLSDRFCIQSNGAISINISATNLLACNRVNDGCGGGVMSKAWNYVKDHGLVTGGDYGSFEGCQPYPLKPVGSISVRNSAPRARTPQCQQTRCTNNKYAKKENRLYRTTKTLQLPCDEQLIKKEIYKNGPVTAGMIITVPFLFYKKGVFEINIEMSDIVGLHAVRLLGWGIEKGIPYWIGANSWGRGWGDNGFFKIKRGSDHCKIESMVFTGQPLLE